MKLTLDRVAVACAFLFIAFQVADGFKNKEEIRTEQQHHEVDCLAKNIYHEARGEPEAGKLAVAFVTWVRANESVEQLCQTVWRPSQFSWTKDKVEINDATAYAEAKGMALDVINGRVSNPVPGATHFHAVTVKPYWSKYSDKLKRIGNHVFYKQKEKTDGSRKKRRSHESNENA